MTGSGSGSIRLFLAAWPAPELQRALGLLGQALQQECGGRALPVHNIHLTLVFIGDIARARLAHVESAAGKVAAPRFHLDLGHVGYWRHNRILWAGIEQVPAALEVLVNRLEQELAGAGFRFDRRPYVPHITLVRNARRAPATTATQPLAWLVSRFALVESVPRAQGRVYEVLREWSLDQ